MSSIIIHVINVNNIEYMWVELFTGLGASINSPFAAEGSISFQKVSE